MVHIYPDYCKSCKLCKRACPKNVFELSGKVNKKGYEYIEAARQGDCILCMMCEKICPDFAIHVEKAAK